jgi:AraC-like DNA-binding protein
MIFNSYAEQNEEMAGIRLVSCGHIFAEPRREIYRPSGRNDWLLFYVAKDQETFFISQAETAEEGSFILFAPGEKQHHIHPGDKTAEFYYIHFQCNSLPTGITLETSHIYSFAPRNQFSSIFEEIIEETLQKRPHYEILCISHLLHLLSLIQREATQINNLRNKQWHSVARAIQHMNRYCSSNLKLEDYADLCCMSKYHFAHVFKQVTGTTPLEYRNRIRIEYAKELLSNSFLSISEIGATLGYTSSAYFSHVFKISTGISPKEYRDPNNIHHL